MLPKGGPLQGDPMRGAGEFLSALAFAYDQVFARPFRAAFVAAETPWEILNRYILGLPQRETYNPWTRTESGRLAREGAEFAGEITAQLGLPEPLARMLQGVGAVKGATAEVVLDAGLFLGLVRAFRALGVAGDAPKASEVLLGSDAHTISRVDDVGLPKTLVPGDGPGPSPVTAEGTRATEVRKGSRPAEAKTPGSGVEDAASAVAKESPAAQAARLAAEKGLTEAQRRALAGFLRRRSVADRRCVCVTVDPKTGVARFSTTVPGKVPGSSAEYITTVDPSGTSSTVKITRDPSGNIVHVKEK